MCNSYESSCCLCRIYGYPADVPLHAAVLALPSLQLLAANVPALKAAIFTDGEGNRILVIPWHLVYGEDTSIDFSHKLPKR